MDYYKNGGLVLSDRYTTSNAVHQGSKLPDDQKAAYFDWLYDFEFRLMELPKPALVMYMDVDIDIAVSQIRARSKSNGVQADIHETDGAYLKNSLRAGSLAAEHLGWMKINCMKNGAMRNIEEIHQDIFNAVKEVFR